MASAERFDVVIVGARCTGSSLATMLARAGRRVCVVDRAAFPSETPSTHMIQPSGVAILERLGVLDRLLAVTPPIDRGTVRFDDAEVELDGIRAQFGAPVLSVRRVTLDAILLEAAAAAGAEVRTRTAVSGLVTEAGRVAGVITATGELRAPLVVGADGARSTVARLVGAEEYHRTAPGRVFLWGYFEGARADGDRMWLAKIGDHAFLAGPTDGGLFMTAVAPSIERREELRARREAGYAEGLEHWPELHACVDGARRVGPVRMTSHWHGFFRRSAGPGWVLAGDAGHFKDPTPGQGISDALRQAVALAAAIEQGSDRALRDWWAWRDRDAWEMYWFAHDLGAPGPTPLVVGEIQRRIAADAALTDGLLRVLNRDVAPSDVFTARLALAATATALRTRPGHRRQVLREIRALVSDEVRRQAARAARRGRSGGARRRAARRR